MEHVELRHVPVIHPMEWLYTVYKKRAKGKNCRKINGAIKAIYKKVEDIFLNTSSNDTAATWMRATDDDPTLWRMSSTVVSL